LNGQFIWTITLKAVISYFRSHDAVVETLPVTLLPWRSYYRGERERVRRGSATTDIMSALLTWRFWMSTLVTWRLDLSAKNTTWHLIMEKVAFYFLSYFRTAFLLFPLTTGGTLHSFHLKLESKLNSSLCLLLFCIRKWCKRKMLTFLVYFL